MIDAMNRSQLEEDDEKVTRETAAYKRLDAVLRVTKPLCEKENDSTDEENDDEPNGSGKHRSCMDEWSISMMDITTMVRVFLSASKEKKDTMINVLISILVFFQSNEITCERAV